MINLEVLFDQMCVAAQQSGTVAKLLQGRVQNEGKNLPALTEDESDRVKAMREAKTIVDEVIQEIILTAVRKVCDPSQLVVDAEENTPSLSFFPAQNTGTSLIIDPVDGTLEYVENKDSYTVCIGVVVSGSMKLALVFFPARDQAYALAADGKSYVYEHFFEKGQDQRKEIVLPASAKRVLYHNSRLDDSGKHWYREKGFEVLYELDHGLVTPDAMLKVLEGEASGFLAVNMQMRDVLLCAIIANAQGGYMQDKEGNALKWLEKGRLPFAVFGNQVERVL